MGIGPSYRHRTNTITDPWTGTSSPNPNPRNFKVDWETQIGEYLVACVTYPDATNFEGKKILMLRGVDTLKGFAVLDPHFQKDGAIVARFAPTPEGIGLAIHLATELGAHK